MICKHPFSRGTAFFGCGQCLPCRINRARQWTWRQYLESLTHAENCFVTLTYDTKNIRGDWALEPRALQLFLKRLRKRCGGKPIRYFAVGEYGEDSYRPHYHLSLFGVSGDSLIDDPAGKLPPQRVAINQLNFRTGGIETIGGVIHEEWGKGRVDVKEFNEATAAYCCGYVTKHLMDRKQGRVWNFPEFTRMSNRPGLGAPAMATVGKTLSDNYTDWRTGDVPSFLLIGSRRVPLPRYLLAKLRQEAGFSDEYVQALKSEKTYTQSLELSSVFQNSPSFDLREAYNTTVAQKIASTEGRYKIWQSKRSL